MTNSKLYRAFRKARNFREESSKTGRAKQVPQVEAEDAFAKILPKGIKPETVKKWRKRLGFSS